MAIYLGNGEYETRNGKIDLHQLENILEDLKDFPEIKNLVKNIFDIKSIEDKKDKEYNAYKSIFDYLN